MKDRCSAPILLLSALLLSCAAAPGPAPVPPRRALPPPLPTAFPLDLSPRVLCVAEREPDKEFCQFNAAVMREDGRLIVAGSVWGRVLINGRAVRSRGMQNAFVLALAPDGTIEWLRQDGVEWHNHADTLTPLGEGRIAVSGVAANGFHPSLARLKTTLHGGDAAERPFLGVLTAGGEWEWITDWPWYVQDVRGRRDGGLEVIDRAYFYGRPLHAKDDARLGQVHVARVGADGRILSRVVLSDPPEGLQTNHGRNFFGTEGCLWQLLEAGDPRRPAMVRRVCNGEVASVALEPVGDDALLEHWRVAVSPDGASFYAAASEAVDLLPGGKARANTLVLWRIHAPAAGTQGGGLQAQRLQPWPAQSQTDSDRLPRALALTATGSTVDVLVIHAHAAVVAGVERPAATLPSENTVPYDATMVRLSATEGTIQGVFAAAPPEACLARSLHLERTGKKDRVLTPIGAPSRRQWLFHGGGIPSNCPDGPGSVVTVVSSPNRSNSAR